MPDRQLPCPDCGSPVRPDVDQLCPTCGYPLMFLRQPAEDDARAVPRSPNERADATGMMAPPRQATSQFPAATYGGAPAQTGQTQCRACGYPNDRSKIRCERCGQELRQARPQAVTLGPHPTEQPPTRWATWLIILVVLAALSLLALVLTLVWALLG